MALYNDAKYLAQETGPEYNVLHHPGQNTPFSGVYRCETCGRSTTSIRDHVFPPQVDRTSTQGIRAQFSGVSS